MPFVIPATTIFRQQTHPYYYFYTVAMGLACGYMLITSQNKLKVNSNPVVDYSIDSYRH